MNLPTHALLAGWIKSRGMKAGAFGALVPISKDVISHIINGHRLPKPDVADRIEQITGGDIKANQWLKT